MDIPKKSEQLPILPHLLVPPSGKLHFAKSSEEALVKEGDPNNKPSSTVFSEALRPSPFSQVKGEISNVGIIPSQDIDNIFSSKPLETRNTPLIVPWNSKLSEKFEQIGKNALKGSSSAGAAVITSTGEAIAYTSEDYAMADLLRGVGGGGVQQNDGQQLGRMKIPSSSSSSASLSKEPPLSKVNNNRKHQSNPPGVIVAQQARKRCAPRKQEEDAALVQAAKSSQNSEKGGEGDQSGATELPKSKYRGVSWDRRMGLWRSKANAVHIGFFEDEIEAAHAYDRAKLSLHKGKGSLSLNFPGHFHSIPRKQEVSNAPKQQQSQLEEDSTETTQSKPKASRYRGVMWDYGTRSWRSKIKIRSKTWYLGVYGNEEDAARAYDSAASFVLRDRSTLNFPNTDYSRIPLPRPPPTWVTEQIKILKENQASKEKFEETVDNESVESDAGEQEEEEDKNKVSHDDDEDISNFYEKAEEVATAFPEDVEANRSNVINNNGIKYGVFENDNGTYDSYITYDKHRLYLGNFATAEEAAKAYDVTSLRLNGSFNSNIKLNCSSDMIPAVLREEIPEHLQSLARLLFPDSITRMNRQQKTKARVNDVREALSGVRNLYKRRRVIRVNGEDVEVSDDQASDVFVPPLAAQVNTSVISNSSSSSSSSSNHHQQQQKSSPNQTAKEETTHNSSKGTIINIAELAKKALSEAKRKKELNGASGGSTE